MNHTLRTFVVLGLPLVATACFEDDDSSDEPAPGPTGLPAVPVGSSAGGDGEIPTDTGPESYPGEAWSGELEGPGVPSAAGDPFALPCVPACSAAACGTPDGCGGVCLVGCACEPSCGPSDCWTSDGCGGFCTGGCCTPLCFSEECGTSDGCGGVCTGGCDTCTPSCGPFDCGASDGCGGTCDGGCAWEPPACEPYDCWSDDGYTWTCDGGC